MGTLAGVGVLVSGVKQYHQRASLHACRSHCCALMCAPNRPLHVGMRTMRTKGLAAWQFNKHLKHEGRSLTNSHIQGLAAWQFNKYLKEDEGYTAGT